MTETRSAAEVRRIALAAQGLAERRPVGRVDRRHVRRVFDRVGLIQVDSVNVLVRSQELPLFARLGPHSRSLLPAMAREGELFEYWGHEASLIPSAHHHLYRWKMDLARRGQLFGRSKIQRDHPEYVEDVLRMVKDRGAVTAADIRGPRQRPKGPWWDWDHAKRALEYLFGTGQLCATRGGPSGFERYYDLPDRVLPAAVLARPTPPEPEARKALLRLAARSMGVATAGDLAAYHRQKITRVRPLVAELVEEGHLVPVVVEGWRERAYLCPDARVRRRVAAQALLSPFDSLMWERAWPERVFGFRYRIEIYTPAPQRLFGYYVLPFLLGDTLVGRVDLKADRAGGALLVAAAWAEPGVDHGEVATALAAELGLLAGWLGLAQVVVADPARGDLAPALQTLA